MNIIIWLVVGGLIGWAASAVLRTQEGMLLDVVVGTVGAGPRWMVLEPARRGIDHQSEQLHRSQLARVVSGSSHLPRHGQSRAAR
jgi:uncharacterized membrane protein YeaQ/YmgE (transglycosylase-associated protein family)